MLAKPDFQTTGFQHRQGYFDESALFRLELQITRLFDMQANKCGQCGTLSTVLERMEANDKDALYQVQKFLTSSQRVRSFFNSILMAHCANLLGVPDDLMLLEGPALFVSRPNTDRLLYKWHSEAHYYPKRRRFMNLWFPIFTDRTEQNGAMHIKPGSHKEHWDFAEYNAGPDTFRQYEIPDAWLRDYPTHVCESKRGDLILFDRNLVHRSVPNRSNDYAFAIVARAWTPIDDLTLSGNMAATPYGGDIGRAGLIVER